MIVVAGAVCFWLTLVVLALLVVAAGWTLAFGAHRADRADAPVVDSRWARAVAATSVTAVVLLAVLAVVSIATQRTPHDFVAEHGRASP